MRPVPPAVMRLVLLAFLVVSSSAILYATVMNELSLGMRWTPRVFTEAGYGFSHGDSFLSSTVPAPPTGGGSPGRGRGRYSSTFNAKDNLEIRGSRVTSQGKPAIIAAEIRKGDQILKLRDENGIPAWSGGGRRQAN